jgi:hypothetical protein
MTDDDSSNLPSRKPPEVRTDVHLSRHGGLGARGFVKFIPPSVEEAMFIKECMEKGMSAADIKKAWQDKRTLPDKPKELP